MFSWFKSKDVATTQANSAAHGTKDAPAPTIRKPQHAARDARMSVPIAEREYQALLDARKRDRGNLTLGTSTLKGKGKGKAPLAYDSGLPSFSSSPAYSGVNSRNNSRGELNEWWDWESVLKQPKAESTTSTSVVESSKDSIKRQQQQQPKPNVEGTGDAA